MTEKPLEFNEKVTPATLQTSGGPAHWLGVDMTDVTRLCSVEGCGRRHASRGFCHKHYISKRYENENMRRAAAARTHRRHGHEFTPENVTINQQGARICLTCTRTTGRDWYRRKFNPQLLGQPPTPRLKTHCAHGHEWTPENTRISVHGRKRQRICRACRKAQDRIRYLARKGEA